MSNSNLVCAVPSELRKPSYTTLIAHRGESYDTPENTLPAYRTAVERGFGFECDIYLSTDGKLFTFHDGNLSRTTDGACTKNCTEVDWDGVVSKLNVGGWGKWKGSEFDPTPPALFPDVLALARDGRYIYVEVKDNNPSWVPVIKRMVGEASNVNPGNVLFISFGNKVCAELKRQMPEYKVYLLACVKDWIEDPVTHKWYQGHLNTAEELVKRLQDCGADGIDLEFKPEYHDIAFIRTIINAGFEVHVWTVDDLETAKKAFAVGVQTVTTNRAQYLLDEYQK